MGTKQQLSRDDYLAHCLWRNPLFQRFLVRLWGELPPIFEKRTPAPELPPVFSARIIEDGGPLVPLVDDVAESIELPPDTFQAIDDTHVKVCAATFDGFVKAMARVGLLGAIGGDVGWGRVPFGAEGYALAIGLSREECRRRLRDLRREARARWPRWIAGRLKDPHAIDYWTARPALVIRSNKSLRRVPSGARRGDPAVFGAARIWIPVYEDTSSADVDWVVIARLQSQVYGSKGRKRAGDYYDELLKIYDATRAGKTFVDLALEARRPLSTVKARWQRVITDITALARPQDARRILRENVPVTHDFNSCPQCGSATKPADMCSVVRDYANQDYVSRKEWPTAAE